MNQPISDNPPTLQTVKERFEAWRSGRANKRESIPQHLWQAAAGLCREYSISRVTKCLHLSYSDLKRRVPEGPCSPLQFMEINPGAVLGRWQIECGRRDGGRLRMTGNGLPPAIDALLKAL